MKIKNWSITGTQDPYQPPELRGHRVLGNVYGHPVFEDTHFIRTSDIVDAGGGEITTKSGSVYELGEPDEEYVSWCRENGCHVPTPEEPIKKI